MEKEEVFTKISDYTLKLKNKSLDLRSKLTSLVLLTEEGETLTDEEKNCILNICEVISKKNNELIYVEERLEEVIKQLSLSIGNTKNSGNYTHSEYNTFN